MVDGRFNSGVGSDFSTLGAAIGENTHLKHLLFALAGRRLDVIHHTGFYDCLKRNTSINELNLNCAGHNIVGGVVEEILKAYQENDNLTLLRILRAGLQNGGDYLVATTLRHCTNLSKIGLRYSDMTDGQLLPIIEAVRGLHSLVELNLESNRISNAGCEALASLLEDPNSNMHTLNLEENLIGNDGAIALANSLADNTKLRDLWLGSNPFDTSVHDTFSKVLCNKASINQTYMSNNTIVVVLPEDPRDELDFLLDLNNENTNKSHVAIKKILQYHPNIDMAPLFEWNMEEDGESNLKALPYVIAWFQRARAAISDQEGESYNIDARELSAIYKFAQAMPLLFVPAS